jgi:hypothetical protein
MKATHHKRLLTYFDRLPRSSQLYTLRLLKSLYPRCTKCGRLNTSGLDCKSANACAKRAAAHRARA